MAAARSGGGRQGATRPGLHRATDVLIAVLEGYCAALTVTLVVIVVLGVWYRYVVQRALPWYDEIAEYLMVWLTFYGAVLAAQRNAHIGFDTLVEYFPKRVQRVTAVLVEVIVLVVQVALFVYGWSLVRAASFDAALSVRWVRLSWVYSAIPISGGLMFLISVRRLAGLLRLWPRPQP